MPITQTRMIALLRAAQDYQDGLNRLSNAIAQQAQQIALGRRTPQQAWELISASSNQLILLSSPIQSSNTILAEAIHFKTHQGANERKARKMRQSREAAQFGEKPHRTTAPVRLDQPTIPGPAPATEPQPQSSHKSTDDLQVQSNSDLNFAPPISPESSDAIAQFLQQQEEKEQLAKSGQNVNGDINEG